MSTLDAGAVPTFSVVTPVCDPTVEELEALWASLRQQHNGSWEWCIADDASTDPAVTALISEVEADSRVSVVRNDRRGGIVAATNAAAALAKGEFLAFVDHDDVLHPAALDAVVAQADEADVLYTDEDVLNGDGERVAPSFKPAWSPERLRGQHYIGHLTVLRRSVFEAVGGLRHEFEGSQDLDLLLRVSERTERFVKVSGALYHWRASARSVAGDPDAKPYVYAAAQRAIEEHCERVGIVATVRHLTPKGRFAAVRTPGRVVTTSVIIVDPGPGGTADVAAHRSFAELQPGVELVVVPDGASVSVAEARNLGAAKASGEVLVFLDHRGRVEPDAEAWQHVAATALEPGVGVIGLANRVDDGSVLDAGLVLTTEFAVPLLADFPVDADINRGDLALLRETSAVSGYSVVVERQRFAEMGGFSDLVSDAESAIDLCLKARLSGRRVLWSPSTGVCLPASLRYQVPLVPFGPVFVERWRPWLASDPYYTSDIRLGRAHYVPGVGYPD